MIGLDANVLARYFAGDDPIQMQISKDILERQLSEDNPGFVSIVAMVELVWVLRSSYGFASSELAGVVETLLISQLVVIQEEQAVYFALGGLKKKLGTFSDLLVLELGARAGCRVTLTFDRKAARLDGFELIQ